MKEFFSKYVSLRKHNAQVAWKKAKKSKMCYAFLAPYAILFTLFYVVPVVISIFYSFTYYNILEKPRFIGLANYISLILEDDIFLIGIKNTLMIAIITGPLGYIMSFLFAWLINELPRWVRSIAVIVFYAPSIAGNCYVIFSVFFRGDAYGYVNAFLMNLGIIDVPIAWLESAWIARIVIVVAMTWRWTGYNTIFYLAGLQNIDDSIYEAARIDGANIFQQFRKITIPLLRPIILLTTITSINGTLQLFAETQNITSGGPGNATITLSNYIYKLSFVYVPQFGYASTIAFIVLIMVAVLAFAQMKMGDTR